MRIGWKQVQAADGVARSEAEKNEQENAPAGAEAFVSEEDAVKEALLGSVLRGRSGDVVRREILTVQEITISLGLLVVTVRKCPAALNCPDPGQE